MSLAAFRRHGNLLRPDGTNQLQRLLPGLEADYIVPDERNFSELVEYAYRVAAEVRYYDLSGQSTGDWGPLLKVLLIPGTQNIRPTEELQLLLASRSDWPPHMVLFLVFLKLFEHLQSDLNQLTQRHQLHFFEKHLGLLRRKVAPDAVHVIFGLAQNAAATRLPSGTQLDAGKDVDGNPLTYATQNELVVNRASIGGIRRVVVDRDIHHNRRFFVADGFSEAEAPGAHTFGRRQLDPDAEQRFMHEASLGFAISAPILLMAEGEREITVLAHLRAPAGASPATQGISEALEVALSGAEGWLVPDSFEATLLADGGLGMPALSLKVHISAAAPAIGAFDAALHGPGMEGDRAVLRCLIKGDSGIYDRLDGFRVDRINLDVDVKGLHGLIVQNDDSLLDAKKPIPLFGGQPRIGSVFYVGSTEVFARRLTALSLNLEWKSPPEDLFEHYRAYFDSAPLDFRNTFFNSFRVDVDFLYDRIFRPLLVNQTLFSPIPAEPKKIFANESAFNGALAGSLYAEQPNLELTDGFGPQTRFGFVRLTLSSPTRSFMSANATAVPFEAFGHSVFGRRYANQAIALSTWEVSDGPKPHLPSEPYLPELSALSLDYRAKAEIVPGEAGDDANFHVIGPFGAIRAAEPASARLVPLIDGLAALIIGVRDFAPPSSLSLYFEIDAGTANGATVLKAGETEWSYLGAGDEWHSLSSTALLIDSTEGFQRPGIVAIDIPADAAVAHQSLPSGLVWLRALIRVPPESAARTLSVSTQAVLARFEPGNRPLSDFEKHLQGGLPSRTITKLTHPNAAVQRVSQPNVSFGGRGHEAVSEYIRRGSERLRHRNRAVTPWDFERLVLERFPDVFKVKCLSHANASGARRAGLTAAVVVPNLRRTGGGNPLEPRAGEVLLAEIAEYLADLTPPNLTLHVIRPVFERIRVEAKVVFTRGRDPGYYTGVLNDELCRFLSPWAYQDGEDILFGARIYRSEILAFIEGRDYVDHLVGLRLFHDFDGDKHEGIGWMTIGVDFIVHPRPRPGLGEMTVDNDFIVGRPVEVAGTTQAHAILVSHPQHLITPVPAGTEICSGVTRLGIGYMAVGLDFNVALEASP